MLKIIQSSTTFVGLFLKIIKKSVKLNIYRKIFIQINSVEILSMLDYKIIKNKTLNLIWIFYC